MQLIQVGGVSQPLACSSSSAQPSLSQSNKIASIRPEGLNSDSSKGSSSLAGRVKPGEPSKNAASETFRINPFTFKPSYDEEFKNRSIGYYECVGKIPHTFGGHRYVFVNNAPNANIEPLNKVLFPAVIPQLKGLENGVKRMQEWMIGNQSAAELLGFSFQKVSSSKVFIQIPDSEALTGGWEEAMKLSDKLPMLKFVSSENDSATDDEFLDVAKAGAILISKKREHMHDVTSHVWARLHIIKGAYRAEKALYAERDVQELISQFINDALAFLDSIVNVNGDEHSESFGIDKIPFIKYVISAYVDAIQAHPYITELYSNYIEVYGSESIISFEDHVHSISNLRAVDEKGFPLEKDDKEKLEILKSIEKQLLDYLKKLKETNPEKYNPIHSKINDYPM